MYKSTNLPIEIKPKLVKKKSRFYEGFLVSELWSRRRKHFSTSTEVLSLPEPRPTARPLRMIYTDICRANEENRSPVLEV